MTKKNLSSQRGSEGAKRLRSLASVSADKRGQMLLIVILVMVVSLTIGLSIASRTITNIKISKESEESQRAFQAAEAGLEVIRKIVEKKRGGVTISQNNVVLSNNSRFTPEFTSVTGGDLNNQRDINQDKGIDVWLMDYDKFINTGFASGDFNGNIELQWWTGQIVSCVATGKDAIPALEVIVLSGSKANPTIRKYFYDYSVCNSFRPGANSATAAQAIVGTYRFSTGNALYPQRIATIVNGIVAKVIPVYNSSRMSVTGSGVPPLAIQGYRLTSTGSSGDTVRKIELFESNPNLPTEMFYSILSQ